MIIARVVSGVKDHLGSRSYEWVLTCMLMQFGCTLLRAGNTFTLSHGYDVMAALASENTWGWGIVTVGSIRFAALTLNGTFRPFKRISPLVRSVTAGLFSLTWLAIGLSILDANSSFTGWGIYMGIALLDTIIGIRVAGEAGNAVKAYRSDSNRNGQ